MKIAHYQHERLNIKRLLNMIKKGKKDFKVKAVLTSALILISFFSAYTHGFIEETAYLFLIGAYIVAALVVGGGKLYDIERDQKELKIVSENFKADLLTH